MWPEGIDVKFLSLNGAGCLTDRTTPNCGSNSDRRKQKVKSSCKHVIGKDALS